MCKTDGDCRKRNPGMDCVRNHRTVYSKVYNGKMLVFWKESKNLICLLISRDKC